MPRTVVGETGHWALRGRWCPGHEPSECVDCCTVSPTRTLRWPERSTASCWVRSFPPFRDADTFKFGGQGFCEQMRSDLARPGHVDTRKARSCVKRALTPAHSTPPSANTLQNGETCSNLRTAREVRAPWRHHTSDSSGHGTVETNRHSSSRQELKAKARGRRFCEQRHVPL